MRTTQWQLSFEGLVLSQESHAWEAGIHFAQQEDYFNIQQAGTRRPVRARLSHAVCADRRFGRIVLTPAGFCTPVETIGIEVDFPVRKFEFEANWLNAQLPPSHGFDFRKAYAQPVFDEPIIAATLDRIYDELLVSRADRGPLLKSLIQILAIDTARCLVARSSQVEMSQRSLAPEQVARIRHLIHTTEFKHLTLAYIAEKCGMRQARLREMFRHTTGRPLRAEIEEARVNAACRQLVETHQPLKMLAHHLAFTHTSAFCYWFKQSTGLTPTEYRIRRAVTCAGDC
jgi:AraC-like DNA-binding protein